MKKVFILFLIVFLTLITSCKQDEKSYIECSKVSCIEDIKSSSLSVYLNIYTSFDIVNLEIKDHKYISKSVLTFKDQTRYQFDEEINNAYLYQYLITFEKEIFTLSQIEVLANNETKEVDIGLYKTITLDNMIDDIKVTTHIKDNKLNIYIHNNLDRTIYLTNISNYINTSVNIKVNKIVPSDTYIYSDGTKSINAVTIVIPNDIYTISGILQLEFTTNLKNFIIYAKYYENRTLDVIKLVSIDTSYFHIVYIIHINVCLK